MTDAEAAAEANDFYRKLFKPSPGEEAPEPDKSKFIDKTFTIQDVEQAYNMTAKKKAVGDDYSGMKFLEYKEIRFKAFDFLLWCINEGIIPKHWRVSRACFLSKDGSTNAEMGEARTI